MNDNDQQEDQHTFPAVMKNHSGTHLFFLVEAPEHAPGESSTQTQSPTKMQSYI